MPKSKKRKMKYTPKSRVVQQPITAAAQSVEQTPASIKTSPAPVAVKTRPMAGKTQAVLQPVNITTELKVLGIFTIVLLAAIVVLYFIFR